MTEERLNAIQRIEKTILDCETRTQEIDEKIRELFYLIKSQGGLIPSHYLKQLISMKTEKEILADIAESSRVDLEVLNLLRPIDAEAWPELEKRAKEIEKFLAANEISEIFRESLRIFKNQLISESRQPQEGKR